MKTLGKVVLGGGLFVGGVVVGWKGFKTAFLSMIHDDKFSEKYVWPEIEKYLLSEIGDEKIIKIYEILTETEENK